MRTLKHIITAALLLCATTAFAYDFEVNGIYYNIISDSEVEVTKNSDWFSNEYAGDIVIPETVTYLNKTYNVTKIAGQAFMRSGITSITIDNNVKEIGESAFALSTNLTTAKLPDGIQSISNEMFHGCSLTAIHIPESVTQIGYSAFFECDFEEVNIPNSVTKIGFSAFDCCHNLTSINIPCGVTIIEYRTFYECSSLASVTIPESVTEIQDEAFSFCKNLTSIYIPEKVSNIGNRAFQSSGLASVTLPANLSEIGSYAFHGTPFYNNLPDGTVYLGKILYSYKGEMPENASISIKEGTVSISGNAFYNCINLTAVNIPNTVKNIGMYAFAGCSNLKSVEIPNGITVLDECVFSGCSSLKTITIPESVTSFNWRAMANCSALEHIYNHAKTPAYCSEGVFENVPVETCVLHVPTSCVEAYQAADGWKDFVNIVGDQAGIEDVTTTETPAEYFDSQGRKVTAPSNGIFIKKQGNTTEKVLL